MKLQVEGVKPPLEFIPPRLNPLMVKLVAGIAPFYVKYALGLGVSVTKGIDTLAREYRRFFNDGDRLILVFRHIHVHDAQVMFYLFDHLLPREARRLGIRLPRAPHAHFLYGRGVPVWAGKWLEWLFSRVGGIPVYHRSLSREGLDVVRSHLTEAAYPIALAPEGQVTYHNGVVHPIEPGFAQLALWAREDLEKKGSPRDVRILPISQYYHYGKDGGRVLGDLLGRIEQEIGQTHEDKEDGVVVTPAGAGASAEPFENSKIGNPDDSNRLRLRKAGAAVLTMFEDFYRRYYGLKEFSPRSPVERPGTENASVDAGRDIGPEDCSLARVERFVDAVMRMQEKRFGIKHPPKGFTPRIFTIRQAGWNRIFRAPPRPGETPPPLDVALDEYIAVEAGLLARHLEVVDLMAYLQPEYALESTDVNRHIEFALNLLDGISRMKGGTIGQRHHVRPCKVEISIGSPISLREIHKENTGLSLRQQRGLLLEEVAHQFGNMVKFFQH